MSNSVDPDETAHEQSHLDLCYSQNPIIIACGSERVEEYLMIRMEPIFSGLSKFVVGTH